MEKVVIFCKYKKKKKIGATFVGVLLKMLKFGQFYSTSWVVPYKNNGMEYLRSQSLWNYMMSQGVELDDITRIFYEHTNHNSRLRKIGREQFVWELQKKRPSFSQPFLARNPINAHEMFLEKKIVIPLHTMKVF
jgi:hypothetical protein